MPAKFWSVGLWPSTRFCGSSPAPRPAYANDRITVYELR
jgi:hypothetical protein